MQLAHFQAITSDPCAYYSCDDQFGQDKDSENEQGAEEDSLNIGVVGNANGNAIQCAQGLFFHHIAALENLQN